ncbi:MAG: histidine-type phosphatase [Pseudoxanthomonas sp.]
MPLTNTERKAAWLGCIAALAFWVAGCASHGTAAAGAAGPARTDELRLQRVVMLMRHGVRPPTKAKVVPAGMHDKPWPLWKVDFGELTQHGYDAVRLLGAWDRTNWAARGLLPAEGCPASTDLEIAASSKSRTQATARALVEGMAPGCGIAVDFPATPDDDVEFHPLDAGAMPIDADEALHAVQALAPTGGMQAELVAQSERFALMDRALGCVGSRAQSGCRLAAMKPAIVRNEGDRPDVGDPFGIASTVSQTFLLQYLEGMPMQDVAWGRLTRAQIEDLLEFHSLKFYYEGRAPYVAARAASPLASRMLEAMEQGPKLTVLVGHDTNIADLGGLLDLHWKVPSYPRDDPPPGGALGFELLADPSGKQFVRAFYRSQTMDQVRGLQPLSSTNAPAYQYLPIPGCEEICPLAKFKAMVSARLVQPLKAAGP